MFLFDFYGVLIPDSYSIWLEKNGLKREGAFAKLINERDKGALTETDFLAGLSDLLGREVTISEIHDGNTEVNQDLVSFARELKPDYQIGLFSNASNQLRRKLEALGIIDLFDVVIISSDIGYAKPSDGAFVETLKILKLSGDEIFFIDDNLKNVESALKNGMHAHHYTSVENLRDVIKTLR